MGHEQLVAQRGSLVASAKAIDRRPGNVIGGAVDIAADGPTDEEVAPAAVAGPDTVRHAGRSGRV